MSFSDRGRVPSPGNAWTRRSFVTAASLIPSLAGSAFAAAAPEPQAERYRAVSWWLTWEDLSWPNDELMDKIRRRADQCAASGVNCCLVFGTHFRWDFMPIWGRVHELLRFIADELHQRRIVLFDHHSSVVVHRTRNRDDALNIWRRNRHHVPFYPSNETAATWEFNGSRLNDWRMIDVQTGQPVYLPAYNAEQFCMNNPAFRESYLKYVKRLVAETGIDGLMSDDGIFYAAWQACGCEHCRGRFQKQYGRRLPPVSDTTFWGNRRSEAFADWIGLRFQTCGDYVVEIQKALPKDFPFFTCCSSSDGYNMPAYGMSYQDFIRGCNIVLLEMAGSTPSVAGTWDNRIPSQLLHLGIARDHRVTCLGLGYGFFPDTAFFVWALNKFLGSDCWFSTLKGRLNAPPAELDKLPDDSELVGEGYLWEKAHPRLFTGDVDTDIAVFFSRATRDYYGQCAADYVSDYHATCLELTRAGISHNVVTAIPAPGTCGRVVLSSVACLSAEERGQLSRFLAGGGHVIATGPTGHYDERARPVSRSWLREFGIPVELTEPSRAGAFPPGTNIGRTPEIARCNVPEAFRTQMHDGWFGRLVDEGILVWRPDRITQEGVVGALAALLQKPDGSCCTSQAVVGRAPMWALRAPAGRSVPIHGLPPEWRVRQYRDGDRLLIHAIPGKVGTLFHPSLQNQFTRERIIEKLEFTPLTNALVLEPAFALRAVALHSPDLAESRPGERTGERGWKIDPSGVRRYFVLECFRKPSGTSG